MDLDLTGLLNLFVRWFHVVVGIAWIGQTWLFGWMDSHLEEVTDEAIEGELWMVHSGGFYRVEKQAVAPPQMPRVLHWFKWEAALTWISGFTLLWIVYYLGGAVVDFGGDVSTRQGIIVGLATLFVGTGIYDFLTTRPGLLDIRRMALVAFPLILAIAWGLSTQLSGRAMFIHVGALFGTIMVNNVWAHIIPSQKQLVAATKAGVPADAGKARQAALRSKHNAYLSIPVVFIMLSNHYPTLSYGHRHAWVLLGGYVLLGWAGRYLMTRLR